MNAYINANIKAIVTTEHPQNTNISYIREVILCRYIPVGTFDLTSVNRPEDTVLINPDDNPMIKKNRDKVLEEPNCNGFISRSLEWNKEYYE